MLGHVIGGGRTPPTTIPLPKPDTNTGYPAQLDMRLYSTLAKLSILNAAAKNGVQVRLRVQALGYLLCVNAGNYKATSTSSFLSTIFSSLAYSILALYLNNTQLLLF
jgi:hypothetical protein